MTAFPFCSSERNLVIPVSWNCRVTATTQGPNIVKCRKRIALTPIYILTGTLAKPQLLHHYSLDTWWRINTQISAICTRHFTWDTIWIEDSYQCIVPPELPINNSRESTSWQCSITEGIITVERMLTFCRHKTLEQVKYLLCLQLLREPGTECNKALSICNVEIFECGDLTNRIKTPALQ